MIKVDLSTALFLYLFFTAVLILALWSFFDLGTKLKTFGSEEKYIWHCTICAHTYIDSKHDSVSRCPRCRSYNQRMDMESFREKFEDVNNKRGEVK